MKTAFHLACLLAMLSALSACSYRYTIRPEEAVRAAQQLQTSEEAVVRARASDGSEVSVRLHRDSWLQPLGRHGEYLDDRDAMQVSYAAQPDAAVGAYEHTHRNTGAVLVAGGAGALLGGVFLQSFYGIDEPTHAIPLAGPILSMRKHFGYEEVCTEEEMFCGMDEFGHRMAGIGSLLTFIFQAAGVAMLVSGAATWDDGAESAAGASASSSVPVATGDDLIFSLEPVTLGAEGAGGAFTLRF